MILVSGLYATKKTMGETSDALTGDFVSIEMTMRETTSKRDLSSASPHQAPRVGTFTLTVRGPS